MLFNKAGFFILLATAATVLAADPVPDKTVTATASGTSPAASPSATPPADLKTLTEAAGPPSPEANKGTDSKGVPCTCLPPVKKTDTVKSPEEDPKPPADDTPSAAGSIFGLLSPQGQLSYLGTSFLAVLAAMYA